MKVINVKVIPNAGKNEVSMEGDRYRVRVTARAVEGKANKAAVEALANFFNVKKSAIKIIRGEKSREKIIEVGME